MRSQRLRRASVSRGPDGGPERLRLGLGALFGALMGAGVGLGVWVIVAGYSPVPFADFWSQFPFLERAFGGNLRIGDLWAQANEHRILLPRLEFLLEYGLFGGTYVFLFSMIAASCLALAAAIAAVVWLETGDKLLTWGAFCVSAIATMSPVNVENFTWAYQVQFVQVFLFAALAIIAVVVAARRSSSIWVGTCALAAVAASYSLANGLLVWAIVLLLAFALGLALRATGILALVGALTVFSYLWHLNFTTRGNLSHPIGMLRYVAVYLGSALRETGTAGAGALGVAGLVGFAILVAVAWKQRAGGSLTTPVGAGAALFSLLTAIETASGRLDKGLSLALSSRYAIASVLFWLGLLLGFLTPFRERARRWSWSGTAYLGTAACTAFVISVTALPSRSSLHAIVAGKELTVAAFRVGVDDPHGTVTGPATSEQIADALSWLRSRKLGPWAPDGMVDHQRFTFPVAANLPTCRGGVESVEPVSGGLRVRGWLAPPGDDPDSGDVALLYGDGSPAGLGRVGTYRKDVKSTGAAASSWTGFSAYARGHVVPHTVVLLSSDHQRPVCRLETP